MIDNFKFADERYYLYRPKIDKTVREILEIRAYNYLRYRGDKRFFEDAIQDYNQFTDLIAKYLKELKIDDPLVISILLRTLIMKDYFTKDILPNEINLLHLPCDLLSHEGMDIVNGECVCRHHARFQNDVLKKANVDSDIIHCYYGDEKTTQEEAYTNQANHMINLVRYNGDYYSYDVYTNYLFHFVNKLIMEQITNEPSPLLLFYKPYRDMTDQLLSYHQMYEKLLAFYKSSKNSHLDYQQFLSLKKEANEIYCQNIETLHDLRSETKKRARILSKKLEDAKYELVDYHYH